MSFVKIGAGPPASFADPVGVLLSCHRRIEDRLATLERSAAALATTRAEALAAAAEALTWLATAGARHTDDEEASFFSRLHGADALLGDLSSDHRAGEAILLALRAVVTRLQQDPTLPLDDELRAHTAALAAAYREHIADEEARLIPLARQLPEAELRAIGLEMRLRRGGAEE